jgi:hypothetical protein
MLNLAVVLLQTMAEAKSKLQEERSAEVVEGGWRRFVERRVVSREEKREIGSGMGMGQWGGMVRKEEDGDLGIGAARSRTREKRMDRAETGLSGVSGGTKVTPQRGQS